MRFDNRIIVPAFPTPLAFTRAKAMASHIKEGYITGVDIHIACISSSTSTG
ncbi:hypothetical protein [Nostoc sp. DedQUE09]|uniref:hypothetical protein n=1 Tax=Nostoc sp. DedQUE09 TaxID=3075394 RepID=UPI002AD2D5DF|nr:hypothetical protein [Nostoc sp. DedQUE09]MDZ7954370.1 hypothetical protein [Nostoc sp. DedQUE09]